MKKRGRLIVLLLFVCLLGQALAGENEDAVVFVHVLPHGISRCDSVFPSGDPGVCGIHFNEASTHVDAFPVFYGVVDYQGMDFGMTWPGTYSAIWTSCGDVEIGGIQWSGDCISHAWYTCQSGPVAVPGFAEIHGSGEVCIIPHSDFGLSVYACGGAVDEPEYDFCAGIGGHVVYDPCHRANEPTTWGSIKSLFR